MQLSRNAWITRSGCPPPSTPQRIAHGHGIVLRCLLDGPPKESLHLWLFFWVRFMTFLARCLPNYVGKAIEWVILGGGFRPPT